MAALQSIRTISVRLGADVSNFIQGINSARRTIVSITADTKGMFSRINAETGLALSQLKLYGTEQQKNAVIMNGLNQKLRVQTMLVEQTAAALETEKAKFGEVSAQAKTMEIRLLRAAKAQQDLKNQIAEMKMPKKENFDWSNFLFNAGFGRFAMMGSVAGGVAVAVQLAADAFRKLGEAIAGAISAGIDFNSMMETNKIALTSFLGSGDKATQMLDKINKFAAITPFQTKDLTAGVKKLIAFGFEPDQVLGVMKSIGDAIAGTGSDPQYIDNIIRTLGSLKARGRVTGEELREMGNLGIRALEMLSKEFGKSQAEILSMTEKGLIPAGRALNALINGMEQQFPDMMNKQSKSWTGLLSTIKDYTSIMLGEATKPFFELVKRVFPLVIAGLERAAVAAKLFSDVARESFNLVKPSIVALRDAFAQLGITSSTVMLLIKSFMVVVAIPFVGVIGMITAGIASWIAGFTELGKAAYNAAKSVTNVFSAIKNAALGNFKQAYKDVLSAGFNLGDAVKHTAGSFVTGFEAYIDTYNKFSKAAAAALGKFMNPDESASILEELKKAYVSTFEGAVKDTEDGADKVAEKLKSFVERVKTQAEQFRDALGLFDKAAEEKLSGERLLARLQGQLKIFERWSTNLQNLRNRLGGDSSLFQFLQAQGAKSAGQIAGLSKLSDVRLKEYESLFNRKSQIGLDVAGSAWGVEYAKEKKVEQIVVNINGGVIMENVDALVQTITRQLQINGVI